MQRLQREGLLALGDPEHQALREALAAWTDERIRVLGERIVNPRERPEMAQTFDEREARRQIKERIVNPRGTSAMGELFQKWLDDHTAEAAAQARAEARAEAVAEARTEIRVQQRRLVARLVSRRFGAGTGERLAELVEPMGRRNWCAWTTS